MITEQVNGKRTRTYEAEDFISVIGRHITSLETLAGAEDPWAAGEMLQLREKLDAAIVRTVARLRKAGYTWKDIGLNQGISAITAHKRYASKIEALDTTNL